MTLWGHEALWQTWMDQYFMHSQCSMEKIALYMQCMHCLCSTKVYIHFLLWWCIVMYAILGFTIWSHIEGDPYPRNSPSDWCILKLFELFKIPQPTKAEIRNRVLGHSHNLFFVCGAKKKPALSAVYLTSSFCSAAAPLLPWYPHFNH